MTKLTALIDADSIAYAAGYGESLEQMEFTADKYMRDCIESTGCDTYMAWAETPYGKQNFRVWVAVTPGPKGMGYKANRISKDKPQWLQQAKEYLHSKWNVQWATNMESEDWLGIMTYELGIENVVKCYIDKDLKTIAGRAYNYNTKEHTDISQEYADWWLGMQSIMGDNSDNIPGCGKGVGEATAQAVLNLRTSNSIEDIFTLVAQAYMLSPALLERLSPKDANKLRKVGAHPYARIIEQARLVRILRARNDVFTPLSPAEWEAQGGTL